MLVRVLVGVRGSDGVWSAVVSIVIQLKPTISLKLMKTQSCR